MVKRQSEKLVAISKWIGTVTELANAFHLEAEEPGGKRRILRDSTGLGPKPKPTAPASRKVSGGTKRKLEEARGQGDLTGCARWELLRERVRERTRPTDVVV